jgi:iron complex outermembrane receptor protein
MRLRFPTPCSLLICFSIVAPTLTFAEDKTLPKVSVVGTAASDDLPDSYSGGQVARGGQVGLLGNRDIMETPFNMTTYTSKLIEDQQARSLGDVLVNDSSVRSNWPRGSYADNFMIRGFNVSNPNVALGGLYGILPVDRVSAETVERVEVLKGPSALLNGMSPGGLVGGNINIVPKRAGSEPLTRLTGAFTADSQAGAHADIGRRFGAEQSFGVRFNGLYRDGETAIDRQNEELTVATLGMDYRRSDVRMSMDLGYQKQDVDAPLRPFYMAPGMAVPDAPDAGSNAFPSWSFVEQEDLYGVFRAEYDFASRFTAFAAIGAREFESENLLADPTIVTAAGDFASFVYDFPYDQDSVSAQAGVRGTIETGSLSHDLSIVATSLDRKFYSSFIAYAGAISNLDNPSFGAGPIRSSAAFQDPLKGSESKLSGIGLADTVGMMGDRLLLTVGVRLQEVVADNFSATGVKTTSYDDDAVSPGVGVIFKSSEKVSLYANYIQGLTQGPQAPNAAANRGEIFAPVKSKQYEAGAKLDTGKFGATVSLFEISQPNGVTDPATLLFGVEGEQRNRGVELSSFGEPASGVRVLAGATFIDGELTKTAGGLTDGNTAIGVPDIQANAGLEWDAPYLSGLTLTGRALYTSSQYLNVLNTQRIPDWTRLDLGARYSVQNAKTPITVRATVENIFDKAYWASTGGGYLTLGAPLSVLLSVSVDL